MRLRTLILAAASAAVLASPALAQELTAITGGRGGGEDEGPEAHQRAPCVTLAAETP